MRRRSVQHPAETILDDVMKPYRPTSSRLFPPAPRSSPARPSSYGNYAYNKHLILFYNGSYLRADRGGGGEKIDVCRRCEPHSNKKNAVDIENGTTDPSDQEKSDGQVGVAEMQGQTMTHEETTTSSLPRFQIASNLSRQRTDLELIKCWCGRSQPQSLIRDATRNPGWGGSRMADNELIRALQANPSDPALRRIGLYRLAGQHPSCRSSRRTTADSQHGLTRPTSLALNPITAIHLPVSASRRFEPDQTQTKSAIPPKNHKSVAILFQRSMDKLLDHKKLFLCTSIQSEPVKLRDRFQEFPKLWPGGAVLEAQTMRTNHDDVIRQLKMPTAPRNSPMSCLDNDDSDLYEISLKTGNHVR